MNVDGGSDRVMKIGRSSNSRSNSCKHCPCRLCASSISLRDFTDDDFLYASTSDKLKLKRTINFKPARKKDPDMEKHLDWLCQELRKLIEKSKLKKQKKAENDLVQGFSQLLCMDGIPQNKFNLPKDSPSKSASNIDYFS